MKFGPPLRILAAAIVCVLVLIGIVVREGMARASGTEVIMRMEAVDPRSLLSGHYVIVSLQEATSTETPCPPGTGVVEPSIDIARGAWVALRQNGDHHSVAGMAGSRDGALKLGPIAVRGDAWCRSDGAGLMRAELGVNRFHINQAEAQRIERIMREQSPGEGRVSAIISIGADGTARLKGLIVDGERIELRWL